MNKVSDLPAIVYEELGNPGGRPALFLHGGPVVGIIETYINADQAIGVHVPASAIGKGDETREQLGADAFTDPGETRLIKP